MPTFGAWESTVLEHCYDTVDYISLHAYYEERDDDAAVVPGQRGEHGPLHRVGGGDRDAVRARGRHSKQINLSFDEWNVWYIRRFGGDGPKPSTVEWKAQPRLIEDEYTVTDAVVVGTFLNSLLRHGDRVTVACQAQLVNVIGLLRSEPGGEAWKQTIAYPFEQMRAARPRSDPAGGRQLGSVRLRRATPTYRWSTPPRRYDAETGRAAVFVANRSLTETATLEVDLRGIGGSAVRGATTLHARDGQDRHASNTTEHDAVVPTRFDDHAVRDGRLTATLPALSWTVFELDARREG